MQIPARTPAMTAMTAATLDTLSGGRFRLGLGVSGPQVSEGWHGVRFDKPLGRTREYVEIVRHGADAARRVALRRRALHAAAARRPGQGAEADRAPGRASTIPIYLAAVGPKNLELTGEIADGWLAIFFVPEHAGEHLDPDRAPAARRPAGRLDGFDVVPRPCRSSSATTRRPAPTRSAAYAALYIGGMGSRRAELLQPARPPDGLRATQADEVQDLYLARDYARRGRRRAARVHRPDQPARARRADRRPDGAARRGRESPRCQRLAVRRRPGATGSTRCAPSSSAAAARRGRSRDDLLARHHPRHRRGAHRVPAGLLDRAPDHRREAARAIDIDDPAVTAFTAVIQVGAIVAAIIYFCATTSCRIVVGARPRAVQRRAARADPDYRLAWPVIIGSLPIGVVGLLFQDLIADRCAASGWSPRR